MAPVPDGLNTGPNRRPYSQQCLESPGSPETSETPKTLTAPGPCSLVDPSSKSTYLPSLVVVGASAGGVEALSMLVSTLPTGFSAPIVLAQHLDPNHPSHLGEILARVSTLPVRTVTDQAPLEAGTIYVIPADCHVEVNDHVLRLQTDGTGRRPNRPSISSLAVPPVRSASS